MIKFLIQIPIIILLFQCQPQSIIKQDNTKQIEKSSDNEQSVEKSENINIKNKPDSLSTTCKEICLIFPENLQQTSLIKKEPIKFLIINNTDNIVIAGEKYIIEKFENGKWTKVNLEGIFTDVGYKILPNQSYSIEIPTYYLRNLTTGKYKIFQNVIVLPTKNKYYFANEFSVVK